MNKYKNLETLKIKNWFNKDISIIKFFNNIDKLFTKAKATTQIIKLIDELSDTSEIGVTSNTQYWKGYADGLTELKHEINKLKE